MEQSEGTFCDAILKICSHYFDLFDVMKDCSSFMPQMNLKELDEIIAKPLSSGDDDDDDSLIGNENVVQPNNQNNDDNTESQDNSQDNSQASNKTTVEVVSTTTTTDVVQVATPLLTKSDIIQGQ